jgi:hypothetical protein
MPCDRLHNAEHVLGLMVYIAHEEHDLLIVLIELGDRIHGSDGTCGKRAA